MTWPVHRQLTDQKNPSFDTVFRGSTGSGSDVTQGPSIGSFNTAASLEFSVQPSNATDNFAFPVPPVVRILNVLGLPISIIGTNITLSVGSGSTVGVLNGVVTLPSSSTGMAIFNSVAFDSSVSTAGINFRAKAPSLSTVTSTAVSIQMAPPSVGTYDFLFPNRPLAGSSQHGVLGSWTTIMDIRWGMQGLNGGSDNPHSGYTYIPFTKTGSDHPNQNGSFMQNFGSQNAGFNGDYCSIISNSEIVGNLGGNVLRMDFPIGFPGGEAPVRIFGKSQCTDPAWGYSYSSTSGPMISVYVAHWLKVPSTFSNGGGAGYKGIQCESFPRDAAPFINHFFNGWDAPVVGADKMEFYALTQNPFTSWRPPLTGPNSGVTLQQDTWLLQECIAVTPSDLFSSGTLLLFENGVLKNSYTTFRMFLSNQSGYINSWQICDYTGGGGHGTPSGQSWLMGPVLVMAAGSNVSMTNPVANPLALIDATGQAPSSTSNGRLLSHGQIYHDSLSGVSIMKVTDDLFPNAGNHAHGYATGGPHMSQSWTSFGNYHTTMLLEDSGWLVDIKHEPFSITSQRQMATGLRPGEVNWAFSTAPITPRILYGISGTSFWRYDTKVNSISSLSPVFSGGSKSLATYGSNFLWLSLCKDDTWAVFMDGNNSTYFALNMVTGAIINVTEARSGLIHDELHVDLENDVAYLSVSNPGSKHSDSLPWILQSDTLLPAYSAAITSGASQNGGDPVYASDDHCDGIRGGNGGMYGGGFPYAGAYVYNILTNDQAGVIVGADNFHYYGGDWYHNGTGNLFGFQGSFTDQWMLCEQWLSDGGGEGKIRNGAIGFWKVDGSAIKYLAAHDCVITNASSQYAELPQSQMSPDGKLVAWTSNMNNSGKWQVFVAKVPTE